MRDNPVRLYKSKSDFEEAALKVFRQQFENVEVYREFADKLKVTPRKVQQIKDIPFLPVEFFKSHRIIDKRKREKIIFLSSGTTGEKQSRHLVCQPEVYEYSFINNFKLNYGKPDQYNILALLPSYLEREGSSLVYMMKSLIELSGMAKSGFYLHDYSDLMENILELKQENQNVILFGVSFALLKFAQEFREDLSGIIIMETGGMKGKGKEMVREELHKILINSFNVNEIHSEYGMTELLSQAYSQGNGLFFPAPWMKILVSDVYDPFDFLPHGKAGKINIIDLANVDSCSFISTSDLGITYEDGSFEVLGRMDNSDIRGCNLLITD